MNIDEYVVLRIPGRSKKAMASYEKNAEMLSTKASRTFGDDEKVIPDVTKMATAVQEVELESAELNKMEISELKEEPDTLTAGVMPMSLHKPTSENAIETVPSGEISWGLEAIGIPDTPYKGRGITVAVLDTGIDSSHPAFEGVELLEKDFTDQGNGDDHGHGTHVAGTLFGQSVAGYGMGVAPGIKKALIGKVLDATGGVQPSKFPKEFYGPFQKGLILSPCLWE